MSEVEIRVVEDDGWDGGAYVRLPTGFVAVAALRANEVRALIAAVRAEEQERVLDAVARQKADAECQGREALWEHIYFTEHGRLAAAIRRGEGQ